VGVNINQFAWEETLDLESVRVMVDWFDFKWVCHYFLCVPGVSGGLPRTLAMWRTRPREIPGLRRSWISEARLKVSIIYERYNHDAKKASFFAFREAFLKAMQRIFAIREFQEPPIVGIV
jgi:hypothetical protein